MCTVHSVHISVQRPLAHLDGPNDPDGCCLNANPVSGIVSQTGKSTQKDMKKLCYLRIYRYMNFHNLSVKTSTGIRLYCMQHFSIFYYLLMATRFWTLKKILHLILESKVLLVYCTLECSKCTCLRDSVV
jgi:hypothetical protein